MSGKLDAPIAFAKPIATDVPNDGASAMRTAMTSGSSQARPARDTSPLPKKDIG